MTQYSQAIRRAALMTLPVALLLGTGSCSQGESDAIHGLWYLDAVTRQGVSEQIDPSFSTATHNGAAVWFQFGADGSLEGEGPCNEFHGSYLFDGRNLESVEVESTAASCGASDPFEMMVIRHIFDSQPGDIAFSDEDDSMSWSVGGTTLDFSRRDP